MSVILLKIFWGSEGKVEKNLFHFQCLLYKFNTYLKIFRNFLDAFATGVHLFD